MTSLLLLLAAVGAALVGGIFFAFSNFVMSALDRLPGAQAIAAMQAINVTVQNPLFFLFFFGVGALSVWLLIQGLLAGGVARPLMVAGALFYLIGSIGVTVAFNVPLNEAMAAADPAASGSRWADYSKPWTLWNHLRTLACLAAAMLFIVSLQQPHPRPERTTYAVNP